MLANGVDGCSKKQGAERVALLQPSGKFQGKRTNPQTKLVFDNTRQNGSEQETWQGFQKRQRHGLHKWRHWQNQFSPEPSGTRSYSSAFRLSMYTQPFFSPIDSNTNLRRPEIVTSLSLYRSHHQMVQQLTDNGGRGHALGNQADHSSKLCEKGVGEPWGCFGRKSTQRTGQQFRHNLWHQKKVLPRSERWREALGVQGFQAGSQFQGWRGTNLQIAG